MSHGMVRPAIVAWLVALAVPASAGELPRRIGMYTNPTASLAMLDSKIALRVRGPIVEGQVTQVFRNDTDHVTEATYIFPLPMDSAVSAMAIDVGTRTIHAKIARRDEAQRAYEDAVTAGLGAGLLDQERPDVFTQTVSAIPAHGTVTVAIRFDTTARYQGGTWELALPMVIAPRYAPGTASGRPTTGTGRSPDTDRSPDASRVTPGGAPGAGGKTEVTIELAEATDVTSPTHDVKRTERGYELVDLHSDHDAIVRWKAPAAAWVEQDDDGGYAAVLAEAPPAAARTQPVHCTLVLDRSATMRGDADAVEHPLVRAVFAALTAKDDVAVTGAIEAVGRDQALRAIEDAWTKGGGVFDLTHALGSLHGAGAPIVLVTDGLIADDRAALAAADKLGVPLYVIGVGPAPNRSLLAQLAERTGGTVRFAALGDDAAALARDVLADVATPPQPLAVTWGTLAATDLVPATLPRIGAGQATLVLARVKRAQQANARVRGDLIGFTAVTPSRAPEGATTPRGAFGRRWGRMKLDELIATGTPSAIADHALRFGLVSPSTSMIAVGSDVVVSGGVKRSTAVPVSVPAGMRWQAVKRAVTVDVSANDRPEAKPADHVAGKKSPKRDDDGDKMAKKSRPSKLAFHDDDEDEPKHANKDKRSRDADEDDDENWVEKKAGDDADERRDRAHKNKKESNVSASGEAGGVAPTQAAPPAAPLTELFEQGAEEDVVVTGSTERRHHAVRLSVALGGGVAASHGNTDGLAAVTARAEAGNRTMIGLEGALWLVGGLHLEGDVLATLLRRGIGPFELGGGFGLHLGPGAGPAVDLSVRTRLPARGLHTYLRYDGALLYHDGTKDGQNTATLGIEASF